MSKPQISIKLLRESNRAIGRTLRLHHRICEKRLSALPIHRAQHMLLMRLAREESTPSQKELAACMEISTAAIAVALKKLEADGYIVRQPDKSDSRVNTISITEKGRKTVEDSRLVFDRIDEAMYEGIGREELDAFTATLKKLEENLKRVLGEVTE